MKRPFSKKSTTVDVKTFSPQEILSSRKTIEAELKKIIDSEDISVTELAEHKEKLSKWDIRRNVAKQKLSESPNNETFKVLLEQAEINMELVSSKINALDKRAEEIEDRREAAKEGLKMLQRMELVNQTGKSASRLRHEIDEINLRASQLSLDSGIDVREIKRAEFLAEAMTELALENLRSQHGSVKALSS